MFRSIELYVLCFRIKIYFYFEFDNICVCGFCLFISYRISLWIVNVLHFITMLEAASVFIITRTVINFALIMWSIYRFM